MHGNLNERIVSLLSELEEQRELIIKVSESLRKRRGDEKDVKPHSRPKK